MQESIKLTVSGLELQRFCSELVLRLITSETKYISNVLKRLCGHEELRPCDSNLQEESDGESEENKGRH